MWLALVLAFFIHVLDGRLVDHQVGLAVFAIYLDAGPVVPLDDAAYFFAVTQNDHHLGARLHLLLVVKIFGIGLFRRRHLLATASAAGRAISAIAVHAFCAVMPLGAVAPFLLRRWSSAVIAVVFRAGQSWSNQLAVGEIFLFGGFGGQGGVHYFFHS